MCQLHCTSEAHRQVLGGGLVQCPNVPMCRNAACLFNILQLQVYLQCGMSAGPARNSPSTTCRMTTRGPGVLWAPGMPGLKPALYTQGSTATPTLTCRPWTPGTSGVSGSVTCQGRLEAGDQRAASGAPDLQQGRATPKQHHLRSTAIVITCTNVITCTTLFPETRWHVIAGMAWRSVLCTGAQSHVNLHSDTCMTRTTDHKNTLTQPCLCNAATQAACAMPFTPNVAAGCWVKGIWCVVVVAVFVLTAYLSCDQKSVVPSLAAATHSRHEPSSCPLLALTRPPGHDTTW